MGNEKSKSSSHHHPHGHEEKAPKRDHRVDTAFQKVSNGSGVVKYSNLKDLFSDDLADCLWKYLSDGKSIDETLSIDEFGRRLTPLFGASTDIYVKICQPIHTLVKICAEAAGAVALQTDVHFINTLIKKMTAKGDSVEALVAWKNTHCPRLAHAPQELVGHLLLGYEKSTFNLSSDILSPMQMWFVQCSLPLSYFNKDTKTGEIHAWSPLYSSAMQGISVNRFDTNVFDYKGHTVTIIKVKDGRTVVLASDTTWRHGSTRYGGPDTVFFEVEPNIMTIEASNSIYSNFKIRSAAFGLSFKEVLKIDKDLSEVKGIEVWGCAGADSLAAQRNLRDWQNRQAENNKKVPLPGNWDDNPDKTLLEMAGFAFSNERANMEMEARRREEAKDNQ